MKKYLTGISVLLFALFLAACSPMEPKGDVVLKKTFLPAITGCELVSDTLIRFQLAKETYLPPGLIAFDVRFGFGQTGWALIQSSMHIEKGKHYRYLDFQRKDLGRVEFGLGDAYSNYDIEESPQLMREKYDSLMAKKLTMTSARVGLWTTFPVAPSLKNDPSTDAGVLVGEQVIDRRNGSTEIRTFVPKKYVLLTPELAEELRHYKVLTLSDTLFSDNHAPGTKYRWVKYQSWEELFGSLRTDRGKRVH